VALLLRRCNDGVVTATLQRWHCCWSSRRRDIVALWRCSSRRCGSSRHCGSLRRCSAVALQFVVLTAMLRRYGAVVCDTATLRHCGAAVCGVVMLQFGILQRCSSRCGSVL
jgi:hypothetical protein